MSGSNTDGTWRYHGEEVMTGVTNHLCRNTFWDIVDSLGQAAMNVSELHMGNPDTFLLDKM